MDAQHGFSRIIGQSDLIRRLAEFASLYKQKGSPPGHILLTGPPGFGKRTITRAFAEEYGAKFVEREAREFYRKGDLTVILTALQGGDIFLVSGLQNLKSEIAEILVAAAKDFRIDLVMGQGPSAKVHPFSVSKFTLLGTTASESQLPADLLEVFPLKAAVKAYSESELVLIAAAMAGNRGLEVTQPVTRLVAALARGNPHEVDLLLTRLADAGKSPLVEEDAVRILSVFGVSTGAGETLAGHMDLFQLSGIEFEGLIRTMLERMGFSAQTTKASGDGGVDVVAELDRPITGGRYLIQCKRLSADSPVAAPTVREFYGAVVADTRAVKGILITTSGFTEQAKEFANKVGLELIDGPKLASLLSEQGLKN